MAYSSGQPARSGGRGTARARIAALRVDAPEAAPGAVCAEADGRDPGGGVARSAGGPAPPRGVAPARVPGTVPRGQEMTGGWVPERRPRRGRRRRRGVRERRGPGAAPEGAAEAGVPRDDVPGGAVFADVPPADAWDRDRGTGDLRVEGFEDPPGAASRDGDEPAGAGRADDPPARQDDAEGPRAWAARLVRRGPWGVLAERWVPEPLRGARLDPGRRGAALLSVIAALAAVVAAVGVWWSRPEPRPLAPVTLAGAAAVDAAAGGPSGTVVGSSGNGPAGTAVAGPAVTGFATSPGPAAGSAGSAGAGSTAGAGVSTDGGTGRSTSPAGPILVSVTGRVRHPGLVTVPGDARVADAIAAAGGALDPTDLTGLNLAAHLSDGDSVVVAGPGAGAVHAESRAQSSGAALPGAAPGGADGGPAGGLVNLNTAGEAALEQLPGVGPVTAAAIVAWRTDHGPFTSVDQVQAVPGIGPAKYAQIAPHATV